jgi:hypothetical protein
MRKYGVSSPLFYLCTVTILCIVTSSELFPRNDYKSFKSIFTHSEKQLFMEWMNKDRGILNVPPVEYMKDVERLADVRIKTVYTHFKSISDSLTLTEIRQNNRYHLHYGMYLDTRLFQIRLEMNRSKRYYMIGTAECMAKFFQDEENMLKALFEGWKHSPSHWEGMMDESYTHMALEMKKTDQGYYACLILFEKFDKKKK